MKIIHRVCISTTGNVGVRKKIEELGIHMKPSGYGRHILLNYFDISEDDPRWAKVTQVLSSSAIRSTTTRTVFTEEEIASAEWVRIGPDFVLGYPMPALDGSWRDTSFNAGEECSVCGIGRKQTAPIHLKGDPRLGKNDFMAINWTFDFFARLEVFGVLSERGVEGVEPAPAIHDGLLAPIETIKQLKVLEEHSPCIIDDNLVRDQKPCEHVKYNLLTRGKLKFSRDVFNNVPDLVRTHEWFGSGHMAFQLVLASAKFVTIYMERGWKGLLLYPVDLI